MSWREHHGERGEWIACGANTCRCSLCDFIITKRLANKTDMCPNCGCFTEKEGNEDAD